ncbi:MAG TPA: chorismate mutase [Bacteroidales bacterium]|nr:chorismate mutase [Bacteroidales bacterium]
MKPVKDCKNIEEVRRAIDELDKEIISLLGRRFQYVKGIVKFKDKDEESIVARERREAVIRSRRKLAVENGLDPDVIEELYRNLISHFIAEELRLISEDNEK